MSTLIKDIATLTTIPELNIQKLSNIAVKCISHTIAEAVRENEDTCIEDIGIGNLIIDISEDELKFKFIPSQQLQTAILNSIKKNESDLVIDIKKILQDKIMNVYKNLL